MRSLQVLVVDHREIFANTVVLALHPIAPDAQYARQWEQATQILRERPLAALILYRSFEDAEVQRDAFDYFDLAVAVQPELAVLLLSTKADPLARHAAHVLKAAGYVHMDLSADATCHAVTVAAAGGSWFAEVPGSVPDFSPEEMDVLHLLRAGRDLEGVRSNLHAAMGTVEGLISSLQTKLGTTQLDAMVAEAESRGLYNVPPRPLLIRKRRRPRK